MSTDLLCLPDDEDSFVATEEMVPSSDPWLRFVNLGPDNLTRQEARLFGLLYANRGRYMPRTEIEDCLYAGAPAPHAVCVYVGRLRAKLKGTNWQVQWGRAEGYRLARTSGSAA